MNKFIVFVAIAIFWSNVLFAQDLIKIPVQVHIIDLTEIGLSSKITKIDVRKDFEKANKIWSQANISWNIRSINKSKGNLKNYKKNRKFLIKNFIPYVINGTEATRGSYYLKLNKYLLTLSNAQDFNIHTRSINIYYIPQILPKQKKGKSTFEIPGYNMRPNNAFMHQTKVDKQYFVNVKKNVFRSGITFIQDYSDINPDRANVLAHELGHQLMLLHDGKKIGEDLMAYKCVNDAGTKLCGKKLSQKEISQARKFYNKYLKNY